MRGDSPLLGTVGRCESGNPSLGYNFLSAPSSVEPLKQDGAVRRLQE